MIYIHQSGGFEHLFKYITAKNNCQKVQKNILFYLMKRILRVIYLFF